jgi:hypothetical protein
MYYHATVQEEGEERGEGHAKQEAKKQRMRSSRDDEKRAGR